VKAGPYERQRSTPAPAASAPPSPPRSCPTTRRSCGWCASGSTTGPASLVVVGMSHQGFTVSLGEHGVGRWIAVFFHGRGGHEPIAPAGTAQERRRGELCSGRRGRDTESLTRGQS
jgi:hypothetical protein